MRLVLCGKYPGELIRQDYQSAVVQNGGDVRPRNCLTTRDLKHHPAAESKTHPGNGSDLRGIRVVLMAEAFFAQKKIDIRGVRKRRVFFSAKDSGLKHEFVEVATVRDSCPDFKVVVRGPVNLKDIQIEDLAYLKTIGGGQHLLSPKQGLCTCPLLAPTPFNILDKGAEASQGRYLVKEPSIDNLRAAVRCV